MCAVFVHFHGDQDQDQDQDQAQAQMQSKVNSLSCALVEVLGDLPAPPPLLHLRPTHHGHQQQAGHQALHLTNLEFTKMIFSIDIYAVCHKIDS